jgi:hypothetical protein
VERTLRVKRLYVLGQYQNIELANEIFNVPERWALDETFCNLVTYLQLLQVERAYNKYEIIRAKYRSVTPEEANALIEDELAQTKLELDRYVQGK